MNRRLRRARGSVGPRTARDYPDTLAPVSPDAWPPTAPGVQRPIEVWASRAHLVQVYDGAPARLTVCRTDGRGGISWGDLQRLKRECGRGDRWAVEVYPADDDIVDVAPMRHLWLMERAPSWAWRSR